MKCVLQREIHTKRDKDDLARVDGMPAFRLGRGICQFSCANLKLGTGIC